jgi:hypothetical protein
MEDKIIPTSKASKTTPNLLNVAMCQFMVKYPKEIKIFRLHRFFISDIIKRGMTFYEAYDAQQNHWTTKSYVLARPVQVYDWCKANPFLKEVLYMIGVRPALVWLPSEEEPREMDWPYILVYFWCCIIVPYNVTYTNFMSNFISELKEIAACDP